LYTIFRSFTKATENVDLTIRQRELERFMIELSWKSSNAILLAQDYFPLSYRSVDENEYKSAQILFCETNNLYHAKRLFLEQYKFALKTYFL